MKLLIDSGNTCIKWAELHQGELGDVSYENSDYLAKLKVDWAKLSEPECIYISSVADIKLQPLLVDLWPECSIKFARSQSVAHGISNAYAKPETLGVDRWLAILAAKQEYKGRVICVVDCGTAITLDCIDATGLHLGGMIMPGWNLMQQALSQKTANLEESDEKHDLGLADNTQSAIYNGRLAAIKGFIAAGMQQMPNTCQLILTGGDAAFLLDKLQLDAVLNMNLVLKGLALEAK